MERLIELLRHVRLKLYEEDLRLCDDQNTVSRLGGGGGRGDGVQRKVVFNPLHPDIITRILHTVLEIFP